LLSVKRLKSNKS